MEPRTFWTKGNYPSFDDKLRLETAITLPISIPVISAGSCGAFDVTSMKEDNGTATAPNIAPWEKGIL